MKRGVGACVAARVDLGESVGDIIGDATNVSSRLAAMGDGVD